MCDDVFEQKNRYLDQVLAERRSYRMFKPDPVPDDAVYRILHAGLLAPYAAAAVGTSKDYFRRFFVMRNGSESMEAARRLVMAEVKAMNDELETAVRNDRELRAQSLAFRDRLAMMQKKGIVPGVGTAPVYIVIAERKGYPPAGLQSLAHCLENMWLKATALDLGFQLVSITTRMSTSRAFCDILGITPGGWDLMGCAVGYPQDELSPSIRPPVEDLTRWLE
jgi:nitroreductase